MTQNRFYSSATKRTTTTVDPGTTGTTLTVADTTSFASLDATVPYTLLINWGLADQEVVNVTGRPSGTTFTIVRGQDGSSGQAHAIGATVDHGVSARDFNEAGAHVGTSTGVHGVTGAVVGTTDTQTLTNKTLTGSTMAVPMLSVYRSAALSLSSTAGTMTVIPWDGEDYEDNVATDAMHNAANPTRLVAPTDGKYLIIATAELSSNASAPNLRINLQLNGTGSAVKWSTGPGSASATNNVTISTVLKLTASTYVEVFVSSSIASHALAVGTTVTYATMSYLSA